MEYCILYRHFDKNQKLLYIGLTNNIHGRISGHKSASKWFLDIANITLEHFPSRFMLIEAEKEAIRNEKPEHNVISQIPYIEKQIIEKEHNLQRQEASKELLLHRIVNFDPVYSLASASKLLDIPDIRIKNLIKTNKIGHIILGYRGEYPKYGITGWQMLEFIEHLQSSETTIKELYGR